MKWKDKIMWYIAKDTAPYAYITLAQKARGLEWTWAGVAIIFLGATLYFGLLNVNFTRALISAGIMFLGLFGVSLFGFLGDVEKDVITDAHERAKDAQNAEKDKKAALEAARKMGE